MRTRRLNLDTDYNTVAAWWTRRGGEAPPLNMLPSFGVIVERGEVPLSCAFLYTISNANLAIVEWEATNPDIVSIRQRLEALHMAFDFFEDWAKKNNVGLITWVACQRGDGRLLAQRGWMKAQGEPHDMLAYVPQKEAACL